MVNSISSLYRTSHFSWQPSWHMSSILFWNGNKKQENKLIYFVFIWTRFFLFRILFSKNIFKLWYYMFFFSVLLIFCLLTFYSITYAKYFLCLSFIICFKYVFRFRLILLINKYMENICNTNLKRVII